MITRVSIKNFKSIYNLNNLEVGRVNIFIGENGSGKSNFLEALVFVSAFQSNKLDNEFLVSRGLRVPENNLMKSAFKENNKENIKIIINDDEYYEFKSSDDNYSQWIHVSEEKAIEYIKESDKLNDFLRQTLKNNILDNIDESKYKISPETLKSDTFINKVITKVMNNETFTEKLMEKLKTDVILKTRKDLYKDSLENFLIYSPENTALRTFEKEGQIQPLGINGEGLLKLLKVVNSYEDKSYINTIIESLKLFDWFEDIIIPESLSFGEDKIVISDRYLFDKIDQRSTNEGFLFILFYITLIVAKETPKAFAIDNIDASLNPKLCTKLMIIICELAKKYDKQIFLTTHNPAILDGIDLNDKEQKLFVVSRNKLGHTIMRNIRPVDRPKSSDDEYLNLSESFLRGYIGGLPKGF
ncbi:ATP-binding protein [Aliarcobacter cryaerophilus]|uniref:AAA family ATPase n=1 Tax=Aliarcobacter cryaerophilus TaxID=28198 RepID=UPI0021B6A5AF|nr:ATP-binding protein [Aliarcobacter cryaerophilus]MCT7462101.1 ATP-binding protein [Aliarcobacter cryaerophilus]